MNEYEQLVLTNGYDLYEDTTDPDKYHDEMKEEQAREYFERVGAKGS